MLLITKTYDQTRQRRLCVFVCQDRGRSYLDTPSHSPLGMPTESPLPRQQAPINRVIDLKKHKFVADLNAWIVVLCSEHEEYRETVDLTS